MIVVSDASPLHYLILVRETELLPSLFGSVLITPRVFDELTRTNSPEPVRLWLAEPPTWLAVQAPRMTPINPRLDPGEAEAIALAQEIHADAILVDDRDGARFAREQGLFVTGTRRALHSIQTRTCFAT